MSITPKLTKRDVPRCKTCRHWGPCGPAYDDGDGASYGCDELRHWIGNRVKFFFTSPHMSCPGHTDYATEEKTDGE